MLEKVFSPFSIYNNDFLFILPCFSRSQWFILSVFSFVSAIFCYKEWIYLFDFFCCTKGVKRMERKSFLHAWLISDLKIYLQGFSFVCFLMYSTLKNYSVLAPFFTFFDFENLFHMFSQIFRFISFLFRSHPEWKYGRNERVRDTEKRKKYYLIKSFFSYSLIYFHCKI